MKKQNMSKRNAGFALALLIIFNLIGNLLVPVSAMEMSMSGEDVDLERTFLSTSIEEGKFVEENVGDQNADIDQSHNNDFYPRIQVTSNYSSTRFDCYNGITYELLLRSIYEYDYCRVSFVTTQGVNLDKYQSIVFPYSQETESVVINFDLNASSQQHDIVLDYHDVSFEKIVITFDVLLGDSMVQTESVSLSILNSKNGIFVSRYGDLLTYDKYITYLHENESITESNLKYARKKMTEATSVIEDDLALAEEFGGLQTSKDVIYFDTVSESVVRSTTAEYYKAKASQNIERVITKASAAGTAYKPVVTMILSIVALSGGRQLTISGQLLWNDLAGTELPAKSVKVQIMDEDTLIDDTLATIYTDENGDFNTTINNKTNIIEKGYDIYVKFDIMTDDFVVVSGDNSGTFSDGYYFTSPVYQNIIETQETEFWGYVDFAYVRALNIHQALLVGYYYYKEMNNDDVHFLTVEYPAESSESNSPQDKIWIEENDYCDWDVILHELGHQVSDEINVEAAFFGEHFIDENLIETHGKETGVNGGWNEGWASYFSMASQNYYNANVNDISNIAYVADNMNTNITISGQNYSTGTDWLYTYDKGYGEGNEAAVTAALLNFVEKGIITHQNLWNMAKANQCDNISKFITTLYANVEKSLYSEIGKILEDQNIADSPKVATSIFSRTTPGFFSWDSASTQDPYGNFDDSLCNYFRENVIIFFDTDYNIVIQSDVYTSICGSSGITIDSSTWYTLASELDGNEFYWCIATSRCDTPITGPYYSSLHKAYFEEAIATISNLNTNYYGILDEDDEGKLFKFTAPITDYYTFYSTGSLDVNVTVYTKSVLEQASGRDENDGEGNNFLYRKHLDAGEIVYLRVCEKNGEGGGFNIAVARTTSCIINESETISINGTDGIWYRLRANSSGTLTFFTIGNIDAYGELFEYPAVNGSTANRLAYDDDSGENTNFMFSYDIEALETVYIRIRGYFSSTNGTCDFAVVWTPDVITLDTCYDGQIIAGGYTIYKFTAPTAGIYTFYTSGDMDTYMDMFNEPVLDGTTVDGWVDYDDDSGTGFNAAITRQLSEDQTVFIRVRGYDSEEDITYGFTVVESKELSIANSSTGYLEEGGMLWYVFSASEDGIYAIYTTGNIDTYGDIFEFFVPDGETTDLIISNDDDEITNEATTNFRIVITLSKGDTIYIRVRGYRTSVTGSFNICVVKQEEEQ